MTNKKSDKLSKAATYRLVMAMFKCNPWPEYIDIPVEEEYVEPIRKRNLILFKDSGEE